MVGGALSQNFSSFFLLFGSEGVLLINLLINELISKEGVLEQNSYNGSVVISVIFSLTRPSGWSSLVVVMFVCLSNCVLSSYLEIDFEAYHWAWDPIISSQASHSRPHSLKWLQSPSMSVFCIGRVPKWPSARSQSGFQKFICCWNKTLKNISILFSYYIYIYTL